MKQIIILLLFSMALVSCNSKKIATLKIGVTEPTAHLLEFIEKDLNKQGVKIELKVFDNYVTPNVDLYTGDLDANFFQHKPYLDDFNEATGTDLVSAGNILIAPIGIYSNKYTTLEELPNNATIGIPNDISNKARCLLILQEAGLIKLNPNVGLKGDVTDIIENNNNLSFKEFKANKLAQQRVNLDAVFINETYAIESNLDSSKDSIYREKPNSPYVNIVAVKKGRENDEAIQILVKTMKTEKVKKYIEKKYKGAVIPAV